MSIAAPPSVHRVVVPELPPRGTGYWLNLLGIGLIHAGAVLALVRGGSTTLIVTCAALYVVRMFAITAVYHRYFAHRSYKTSRVLQFLLALLGTTAAQKGPLWWASTHRIHHKHSDTERDVHSPARKGFWYAHMGWWLGREHERTDLSIIKDFAGYPELVWLDRNAWVGPVALIAALAAFGGFDAVLWGFALSTCLLAHGTFTINSLAHVFGSRRYATTDTSRNNLLLALITLGEGWHNNHHHYMNSANQGFFWWEIDVSYYALRGLAAVGLVWDLRLPPAHALSRNLLAEVGERCPLLVPPERAAPGVAVGVPAAK